MIAVIVFYSMASGKQAALAFSNEFKHCNIITFDGSDWLMLDFDRTGFVMRRIKATSANALLRGMRGLSYVSAIITLTIENPVKIKWKPWLIRSCNEFCRYTAGVDIGITFNPRHLYSKLLKYNGRNYQVLTAWRRKDGISKR